MRTFQSTCQRLAAYERMSSASGDRARQARWEMVREELRYVAMMTTDVRPREAHQMRAPARDGMLAGDD